MENQTFGQYISKIREERGISQRALANTAGLTNSTISRIEADLVKPDTITLDKISNALNVDINLLLTKCGYSDLPEDFFIIARKTGELNKEQQIHIYNKFNETIDQFLDELSDEED